MRIKGEHFDLDEDKILEFFEGRAKKYSQHSALSTVLYQDKAPQIAINRDRAEKQKIGPLLEFSPQSRVLDIGCGIGRWGEEIGDNCEIYLGIDVSLSLIEIAKARLDGRKYHFMVAAADKIDMASLIKFAPFDIIIFAGIMIYLNDKALNKCLEDIAQVASTNTIVYIREPLAIEERLTLNQIWSDDLEQEYSAIYRTEAEICGAINNSLVPAGFKAPMFSALYDDESLNNRSETRQSFAIVKKVQEP